MPERSKRAEISARRFRVRQMERLKMRVEEMAKELGVTPRTIWMDKKLIHDKIREQIFGGARDDELYAAHRLSIEVLEERQRKLLVMESDPVLKPFERIEATRLIAEIELEIHRLIPYERALIERAAQTTQQRRGGPMEADTAVSTDGDSFSSS